MITLLIAASIIVTGITWRTLELREARRQLEESLAAAQTVAKEYRDHFHPNYSKRLAELERRMNLAFPQPMSGAPFRTSPTARSEWDEESSVS